MEQLGDELPGGHVPGLGAQGEAPDRRITDLPVIAKQKFYIQNDDAEDSDAGETDHGLNFRFYLLAEPTAEASVYQPEPVSLSARAIAAIDAKRYWPI